jgi:hypothetical protein
MSRGWNALWWAIGVLMLVIAFLIAGKASAHAQAVCAEKDSTLRIMAQKETLVAQGVSLLGHLVQIWVSEKTGTYTIITIPPGRNMLCFLDMGTDWEAPKQGNPT